jgi:hypothetical protein
VTNGVDEIYGDEGLVEVSNSFQGIGNHDETDTISHHKYHVMLSNLLM